MLDKFRQYKLNNCRLEPFSFLSWRRGAPASLRIRSPIERDLRCYELPYSSFSEGEGVVGELLNIDSGSVAEIAAREGEIKGRVVISNCSSRHRMDVYGDCVKAGAVAFILRGREEGMILPTGAVAEGRKGEIPAISMCHEEGMLLERLGNKGKVVIALQTHGRVVQDTTWNVVGEVTGKDFPDEQVIMGGHLDSHDIGPCAYDNGAGAVQVMETARLVALLSRHIKRTVIFIGFAGEEIGLLGSYQYAKKHAKELHKTRFMLNSDCPHLGNPKGFIFHLHPTEKLPQNWEPYINMVSRQLETPLVYQERFHSHSDHYPFVLKGVATAGMGGGRFGAGVKHFMHMAGDTPEKISITGLRDGAAFAASMLLRAANDDNWPNMRRSPSQIKKLLQINALSE